MTVPHNCLLNVLDSCCCVRQSPAIYWTLAAVCDSPTQCPEQLVLADRPPGSPLCDCVLPSTDPYSAARAPAPACAAPSCTELRPTVLHCTATPSSTAVQCVLLQYSSASFCSVVCPAVQCALQYSSAPSSSPFSPALSPVTRSSYWPWHWSDHVATITAMSPPSPPCRHLPTHPALLARK